MNGQSLSICLLGGFRVERANGRLPVTGWQRSSAKALTKLLATYPRHALHREQVVEILWPNVDPASALNTFGKALHAARRAFEPDLPPRQSSAYLCLTDSMLALNTDRVTIDADRFQLLAERALKEGEIEAYESALAAYGGELLPEDRYEDWCAERRDFLAGLHIRLLTALAEALEKRGAVSASIDRFHEVLQHDPTREDVHRRLMVLYAETGSRDQAVRQFQLCEDALRGGLGLTPENATLALRDDVLANRIPRRLHVREPEVMAAASRERRAVPEWARFVDRDAPLGTLRDKLAGAEQGQGAMVLVAGEAGVGKTRLVGEFSEEAARRGATVLSAGSGAHASEFPYAPFAVALDGHIHGRLDQEQVTRALDDLAEAQPVVLVLGDLHSFSRSSLDLLDHLGHLAGRRRWLILATVREEDLEVGSDAWTAIEQMTLEGLCQRIEVGRLDRAACDDLVHGLLPGGQVDSAVLAHVYDRTLGNPLFAKELVRELLERGELLPARGRWRIATRAPECVPTRVRTLVAMRLAAMPASARRAVALAAAHAPELTLDDLRAGAAALDPPLPDAALFDGLDRALAMRLIEERDGRYAFCHPLVRAALYDDLPRHRRDQLHAALSQSAA